MFEAAQQGMVHINMVLTFVVEWSALDLSPLSCGGPRLLCTLALRVRLWSVVVGARWAV